jgi:hypothetical protein
VTLTIRRNGERLEQRINLTNHRPLVPGRHSDRVEYFVFGGVVFQPLTVEYLRRLEQPPSDLANHAFYQNVVTEDRRQVILLQKVLPHAANQGYEDWQDRIVKTANGVSPQDLAHLVQIVEEATGPWLRIVTEDESVLTLSLSDVRAAQPKILSAYGIGKDRCLAQDPNQTGHSSVARIRSSEE